MKYIDASCPYCGAPVIMDNNGRGLCEYCGQWVIYDNRSSQYVLEDAYRSGYDFEKGRQEAADTAGISVVTTIPQHVNIQLFRIHAFSGR